MSLPLPITRTALLWLMLSTLCVRAQTVDEAARTTIRSLIEFQLAAFARDDADAAFGLASDAIQQKFGDARTFLGMVKSAYPVVYRPASVAFLAAEGGGDRYSQPVHFADYNGQLWLALYALIRLPDGSWRINGCALQPLPGSNT